MLTASTISQTWKSLNGHIWTHVQLPRLRGAGLHLLSYSTHLPQIGVPGGER